MTEHIRRGLCPRCTCITGSVVETEQWKKYYGPSGEKTEWVCIECKYPVKELNSIPKTDRTC